MKQALLAILLFSCTQFLFGQERIDGSMDFKNAKDKKYSIYVPSSYQEGTENRLMVALHPWNTNRWGAKSWCDTLVDFAEKNALLVLCTDGGSDGKVDDDIDTAFTSTMLDSMRQWYSVDEQRIFLMGFSWGARTTYTYGLSHIKTFAGFMPIGAAIAVNEVPGAVRANAKNTPWYVIHGSLDAPTTRYTPLLGMLNDNNAITETNYLTGVGHTIDFSNRNKILTSGFQWLDSTATEILNTGLEENPSSESAFSINYSPTANKVTITSDNELGAISMKVHDLQGREVFSSAIKVSSKQTSFVLPETATQQGVYIFTVTGNEGSVSEKIVWNSL